MPENKQVVEISRKVPLQDFFLAQNPLLVGVISHLIGSQLQDLVEQTVSSLLQRGRNLLEMYSRSKSKGNSDENQQNGVMSAPAPKGAGAVQLGGSAAGPPGLHPAM
ncbi:MAG: hypothetical protein QMD10_10815 [Desulfitobacteriaceae bacterium]|nr:hypothetical protein [Desulfitobacteriaceae bacterium]